MKKKAEELPMPIADEPVIYLAITRGRNRLVISGSFDLYREFLQASFPLVRLQGDAHTSDTSRLDNEAKSD